MFLPLTLFYERFIIPFNQNLKLTHRYAITVYLMYLMITESTVYLVLRKVYYSFWSKFEIKINSEISDRSIGLFEYENDRVYCRNWLFTVHNYIASSPSPVLSKTFFLSCEKAEWEQQTKCWNDSTCHHLVQLSLNARVKNGPFWKKICVVCGKIAKMNTTKFQSDSNNDRKCVIVANLVSLVVSTSVHYVHQMLWHKNRDVFKSLTPRPKLVHHEVENVNEMKYVPHSKTKICRHLMRAFFFDHNISKYLMFD